MERTLWAIVLLVSVAGLGGCVAPKNVKDASVRQSLNLAALEQAAKQQRLRIDKYYEDLIGIERRAFVASKAQTKIDDVVTKASLGVPDNSAQDHTSANF